MSRPISRFTLANLLLMVAVFAAGLAGLRVAADWMVYAAVLLTLGMLLVGLLGAILYGRRAGGWVGFALFGWSYAVLSLLPLSESADSPISLLPIKRLLQTIIEHLHPVPVHPQIPAFAAGASILTDRNGKHEFFGIGPQREFTTGEEVAYNKYENSRKIWEARRQSFVRRALNAKPIGHSLFILTFGFAGMIAGKILSSRRVAAGN